MEKQALVLLKKLQGFSLTRIENAGLVTHCIIQFMNVFEKFRALKADLRKFHLTLSEVFFPIKGFAQVNLRCHFSRTLVEVKTPIEVMTKNDIINNTFAMDKSRLAFVYDFVHDILQPIYNMNSYLFYANKQRNRLRQEFFERLISQVDFYR